MDHPLNHPADLVSSRRSVRKLITDRRLKRLALKNFNRWRSVAVGHLSAYRSIIKLNQTSSKRTSCDQKSAALLKPLTVIRALHEGEAKGTLAAFRKVMFLWLSDVFQKAK